MRVLALLFAGLLGLPGCGEPVGADAGADGDADADWTDDADPDAGGDADQSPVDADDVPPADADEALDAPPTDGCGRPAGENDRPWTLVHDGRERSFLVHVPSGYDPARPTPVVLNFHGRGSTAQQQITVSHMVALSNDEGFVAVHPVGVGQTFNAGLCCGEAMESGVDDVGFTSAILDALRSSLCIDPGRVYATGLSNGGFMAHRLACDLADRIAAIGPVAGSNGTIGCSPSRPVPVFHFHGTADTIVPYDGFAGQLAVPATMEAWAARNGCGATSSVFFEEGDVRCEEWTGCADDATVRLCTIDGGGHQWPGGTTIPLLGPNTDVISASQMMWDFFEAHPMP
jgi:polyhydroxybutyrate depolymerase